MVEVHKSELTTFNKPPQDYSAVGSSILRVETSAQSLTKTSFQISARTPSLKAALLLKDCCIRTLVKFPLYEGADRLTKENWTGQFKRRPFGMAYGVQSLTVTLNNASWSFSNTLLMQVLAGAFGYGDYKGQIFQNEQSDKAPYNATSPTEQEQYTSFPEYWDGAAGKEVAGSQLACAEFVLPLPVGIFLTACLPQMKKMSGFEVESCPHVNELTITVNMKPNWIRWLLQSPAYQLGTYAPARLQDARGDRSVKTGYEGGTGYDNKFQIGLSGASGNPIRWENYAVEGGAETNNAAYVQVSKPRLCTVWSNVPTGIAPTHTIGYHNFVTYREVKEVAATKEKASVTFSNIQMDVTPNMMIVVVRELEDWHSANYFCPIDWSTVKIQTSTSSAPVGNIATVIKTNMFDQYRCYKNFTGNYELSYDDWRKFRQAIVISATEMSGFQAYKNCYNPLSISVSFDFYRDAGQRCPGSASAPELGRDTKYEAYLVQIGDSNAVLSEGSCKVHDIKIAAASIEAAQAKLKPTDSTQAQGGGLIDGLAR